MSSRRIALRYARPLLDLAEEQKALEPVKADMQNFAELCSENRDFLLMLRSPIIPHLRKAEILKQIFSGKVHDLTISVIEIIARKNREALLPEIADEFVTLYNERMGLQEAVVTTTFPIDDTLRGSFKDVVKNVTGKEALLDENVNEDILGGYVLRMGDQQLDESIVSHLKEIRLKFNQK